MTEEQIALARRAVACSGFRWLPGMLTDVGGRIIAVYPMGGMDIVSSGTVFHVDGVDQGEVPDLTDPATLGCLLALVREAWGDPYAFVGWFDPHWKVIRCRTESLLGCLAGRGDTEAKALVAALEAAP